MMRKASTSFTPPRRGRPPKKQSVSGERVPTKKTDKSVRGRSLSTGRFSRPQRNISDDKRPASTDSKSTPNQKKRNAASPASSVGSSSGLTLKRQRTSTDSSTSLNERSSSRRASVDSSASRDEKKTAVVALSSSSKQSKAILPKTRGKAISKLLQSKKSALTKAQNSSRLKSLARAAKTNPGKSLGSKLQSPNKEKLNANGMVPGRRGRKRKVHRDGSKDLKDSLALEMKRLSTTDGFWSSANDATASSPRPGSEQGDTQKNNQNFPKHNSRTSTPDVSPSSVRRKSLTTASKESKKEDTTPRSNIPMSELRRLETTEGFWSPNFTPMVTRTASRDVSPSSTSSVDRGARQSTRSHSRGNDETAEDEPDAGISKNNIRPKSDSSKATPKAQEIDSLPSKSLKKMKTRGADSSEIQAKEKGGEDKTRVSGRSALNAKLVKSNTLLRRSQKYVKGAASFSNKQQIKKTKEKLGEHFPSSGMLVRKSPLKMKNAEISEVKGKFTDHTPRTSLRKYEGKDDKESASTPADNKAKPADDSSSSSPELIISDLFKSPELKRLNTTPGFWAPIPNIRAVLGRPHSRRFKESNETSLNQRTRKNQLSPMKGKLSPVKPESSLLQHRKKTLHSLKQQQTMKRKVGRPLKRKEGMPCLNKELLLEPQFMEGNNTLSDSSSTAVDGRPRKKRFIFGVRKRKGKKCFTPKTKVWLRNVQDTSEEEEEREEQPSEPPSPDHVDTPGGKSLPVQQKVPKKTWQRGRKKLILGADRKKAIVGSKSFITRGRVKSSLDKSLDVLQKVEATNTRPKKKDKKTEEFTEAKIPIDEKRLTAIKSVKLGHPEEKTLGEIKILQDIKTVKILGASVKNKDLKGDNLFENFQISHTLDEPLLTSNPLHSSHSVQEIFLQPKNEKVKQRLTDSSEIDKIEMGTDAKPDIKSAANAVSDVKSPLYSTPEVQIQVPVGSTPELEISTNSGGEIEISTNPAADGNTEVQLEIATDAAAEVEICTDSKVEIEADPNTRSVVEVSNSSVPKDIKLIPDTNKTEVPVPEESSMVKSSDGSSETFETVTLEVEKQNNQNSFDSSDQANVDPIVCQTRLQSETEEQALAVVEKQCEEDKEKSTETDVVLKDDSQAFFSTTEDLKGGDRLEETQEPKIEIESNKALNLNHVELEVEEIQKDVSLSQENKSSVAEVEIESSGNSTKEAEHQNDDTILPTKVDNSLTQIAVAPSPDISSVDAAFQQLNVGPSQKIDEDKMNFAVPDNSSTNKPPSQACDTPSINNGEPFLSGENPELIPSGDSSEPNTIVTEDSKSETIVLDATDKKSEQNERAPQLTENVSEQSVAKEIVKGEISGNHSVMSASEVHLGESLKNSKTDIADVELVTAVITEAQSTDNKPVSGEVCVLEKEKMLSEVGKPPQMSSQPLSGLTISENVSVDTLAKLPCDSAIQNLPSSCTEVINESKEETWTSMSPNESSVDLLPTPGSQVLRDEGNETALEAGSMNKHTDTNASDIAATVSNESVATSSAQQIVSPVKLGVRGFKKRKKQTTKFSRKKIRKANIPNVFQDTETENTTPQAVLEDSRTICEQDKTDPLRKVRRKKRKEMWKRGIVKPRSNFYAKNKNKTQVYVPKSIEGNSQGEGLQTSGSVVISEVNPSTVSEGTVSETTDNQTQSPSTNAVNFSGTDLARNKAAKIRKTMLRRLQTNANLANAVLDEDSFQRRFLRDGSVGRVNIWSRRKKLRADPTFRDVSQKMKASARDKVKHLRIDIPGQPGQEKRKPGRPRKLKNLDPPLPKLTPTDTQSPSSFGMMWDKAPPRLSPQIIPPGQDGASSYITVFSSATAKTGEADYVEENVDETDLHLYLSGASEDEPSPIKDPSLAASYKLQSIGRTAHGNQSREGSTGIADSSGISTTLLLPFPKELKSPVGTVKEPKRPGRKKMKGRRGRPPGTPMTEEEKKRKEQEKASLKTNAQMITPVEGNSSFKRPRTARKSLRSPSTFATPPLDAGTPSSKFSLRKKSTRSPLEMLEMKRKKEEARYDLEEERRQARLFHLREKRNAKESGDGLSDAESGEEHLKSCSVVLNDFVKKLQLDSVNTFAGGDQSHHGADRSHSPESGAFDDGGDEDWCANLEDFDENEDGEWSSTGRDKRPFIPRLKIKRVLKSGNSPPARKTNERLLLPKPVAKDGDVASSRKGKSFQSMRVEPMFILPKPTQQIPIKLVIKTEPVSDLSDHGQTRTSSALDLSKVQRSGFEGSFVDFLTGKKNEEFMNLKPSIPKRTYVASKPQENGTNPFGPSGDRASLVQSSASEMSKNPVLHQRLFSALPSTSTAEAHTSAGKAADGGGTKNSTIPARSEPVKSFSSVDEEDEDILILDLEDAVHDQNSNDSNKDVAVASSCLNSSKEVDNALDLRKTASSKLNDSVAPVNEEMGLMLESYNENEDQGEPIPSSVVKDTSVEIAAVTDSVINRHDSVNKSSRNETSSNEIVPEAHSDHLVSATPVVNSTDTVLQTYSSAQGRQGTTTSLPESSSLQPAPTSEAEVKESSKDKEQVVTISRDSVLVSGQKMTWETADKGGSHQQSSPRQGVTTSPEVSLLTSSSRRAGSKSPGSHENNVLVASKSPSKVVTPPKKPTLSSDNSKSPKHSTYIGSEPEEWKVKVILQSDKSASGKYRCRRCNFTTPTKLTIESHIYSHIPGVQFRCAYCESEFSSMAATSSHLKNTHSLREAKLHISRHIDESNFYEKEDTVFSDEKSQMAAGQASNSVQGGQSPPVVISVVVSNVSGAVNSSRPARSVAPSRRFVCTHCGFSTNVREDAEHHALDLHPTDSLFACVLCREDIYYTESEIKQHSTTVHPSRSRSYRKLPDFYDVEHLKDERGNLCGVSSVFQSDETESEAGTIDHRQKAKDYLYLQEYWKEKRSAEADSTTAVDYTEEHNEEEEIVGPGTEVPEECSGLRDETSDLSENEVSTDLERSSVPKVSSEKSSVLNSAGSTLDDTDITSSAGPVTTASVVGSVAVTANMSSHAVPSEDSRGTAGAQPQNIQSDDQATDKESPRNLAQSSSPTVTRNSPTPEIGPIEEDIGPIEEDIGPVHADMEPGPADDDMGLKIVQVVSLSEQNSTHTENSQELLDNTEETSQAEKVSANSTNENPEVSLDVSAISVSVSEAETLVETVSQVTKESKISQVAAPTSSAVAPAALSTTAPTSITTSSTTVPPTSLTISSSTTSPTSATTSSSTPSASFAGGLPLSYKCNACKVHTPYLLMMVKHLKAKHPNMRCFACPYCKTTHSFVSQKQLRQHVKQFHPEKIERNEIALSEEAKKFVEAMVLPNSPECIRVGNRVVLEEHIHTCTYCQVKMTSLANVYEHLNGKHSDLFEFVCPVCQSFKSKNLQEISDHCQVLHESSLDTDKVHVSVPKNLFTVLTCISKNGKYIEKTMDSGQQGKTTAASKGSSSSSPGSAPSPQKQKVSEASPVSTKATPQMEPPVPPVAPTVTTTQQTPTNPSPQIQDSVPISIPQAMPSLAVMPSTPLFAIPLVTGGLGLSALQTSRKPVAISSALFDTSSLTSPPMLVATSIPQPASVIQSGATPSFLFSQKPHSLSSKESQLAKHLLNQQQPQPSKVLQKSNTSKNLPVLNVPTVKPRVFPSSSGPSPGVSKRIPEPWSSHLTKKPPTPSSISPQPIASISHSPTSSSSLPSVDNLPEDEPNPDAFKIFNLRPNLPPPAPPTVSQGTPTVYPPVSSPLGTDYIQGPIAGFPAGMVIPHHLLSRPYPYKQQSPVPSPLPQRSSSPSSRHPRLPHQSSLGIRSPSLPTRSLDGGGSPHSAAATNTRLLKSQQQKELYLLKQKEMQRQRMIKKHNQQQLMNPPQHSQRPQSAHQLQSPTSSPMYPLVSQPMLSQSFDQQQAHMGPRHIPHPMSPFSSMPSPALPTSSSPSLSQPPSSTQPPNTTRPVKGIHKRSSSMYQCPYCPTPVTLILKPLEVASHIQQYHPGKQVIFKKFS